MDVLLASAGIDLISKQHAGLLGSYELGVSESQVAAFVNP